MLIFVLSVAIIVMLIFVLSVAIIVMLIFVLSVAIVTATNRISRTSQETHDPRTKIKL
jgi:hypothetical protein